MRPYRCFAYEETELQKSCERKLASMLVTESCFPLMTSSRGQVVSSRPCDFAPSTLFFPLNWTSSPDAQSLQQLLS